MKNSTNGILLKYYDILLVVEYVEYIKTSLSVHNYLSHHVIYQYDDNRLYMGRVSFFRFYPNIFDRDSFHIAFHIQHRLFDNWRL
jgi:hypothetical protein